MSVASFVLPPVSWGLSWLPWRTIFGRRPPEWAIRRYLVGHGAPAELVAQVNAAVGQVPPRTLAQRVRSILAADAREPLRRCPARILYLQATEDRPRGC